MATDDFFRSRGLERGNYYLMTCHRRENVHIRRSFENILALLADTDRKIYFPASYRTQKVIRQTGLTLPPNVIMVDPIGYEEILCLMVNSRGVITDSGTVVEEKIYHDAGAKTPEGLEQICDTMKQAMLQYPEVGVFDWER